MKKIVSLILAGALLLVGLFAFASCGDKETYVALDASDLLQEDFGIAVTKGNTALLTAVNAVVDKWVADGTMTKYVDYYTALSESVEKGTAAPDANGLKTSWDFGTATETITMYTESGFAPFEFLMNEKVVGVDAAIMSEVAVNLGKKLEVQDVAFDTIPTCVSTAKGDAVGAAGMTISDERKESVDFSSIYFSSTLVVVSAESKSYSSLKALDGLKVGVQEGTSADLILEAAKKAEGYSYEVSEGVMSEAVKLASSTTVSTYKQYALALADLKAGRIDAILMDKLPAQAMLAVAD